MNEYIRAIFLLNKAVAFAAIKPFYYSISHRDTLLSKISHGSKLQVATLTNRSFLQNETGTPIKDAPLLIVRYYSRFQKKIKRIIRLFYLNMETVRHLMIECS